MMMVMIKGGCDQSPHLLCLDLKPGGRHLHLNPDANFFSVLCHPPTPLFPCTLLGHPAPPPHPASSSPCPLLPPPACTRSFLPSSHMEVRGDPSLPRFRASRSPVRLRGKRRAPPSRYRLVRLSVLRGSFACALTGNLLAKSEAWAAG